MHILTRCLEFPEVDVNQDKVDDRRAVLFAFFRFEDVALLQALAVKDFGVDFGERKLVHSSPLFCQQELLLHKCTNEKKGVMTPCSLRSFLEPNDCKKESDLEWGAGVAGSCRKVEGDDEVDTTLRPQDEGVGKVVSQAAVHYMDLLALYIQRLVNTIELVWV